MALQALYRSIVPFACIIGVVGAIVFFCLFPERCSIERSYDSQAESSAFEDDEMSQEQSDSAIELEEEAADSAELSEEDVAVLAEESAVEDFDALTDKWRNSTAANVDLAAISEFAKSFHRVPESRRDECIHRALNLIPDENVMLLTGVLLDPSMPKEIVEAVFGDILNRDDAVKMMILKVILKDKTHPCWEDAAWILEASGEMSNL